MNLTIREKSTETYKHTEVTKPNYNPVYIYFI